MTSLLRNTAHAGRLAWLAAAAALLAALPACSKGGGTGTDASKPANASSLTCELPPPKAPGKPATPTPAVGKAEAKLPPPREMNPVEAYPERRYRIEREGRPEGYLHVTWSFVSQKGRRLVRDETITEHWTHRKIAHMNDVFATRSRAVSIRTEDGELIETRADTDEGEEDGRNVTSSLVKTGKGYAFSSRIQPKDGSPATEVHKEHAVQERIVLDSEAFLVPILRKGTWKEGEALEFHLLSGEEGTVHLLEARRAGAETLVAGGRKETCAVVEIRNPGTGATHRELYTPDGLLLRLVSGDMVYTFSTPAEIETLRKGLREGLVSHDSPVRDAGLRTWPDLPGAFNLKSLLLEAAVRQRPNVPPPPFEDSPFMEVVSRGEPENGEIRYVLRLKAHAPEGSATLPIPPEGFEKFLEGTTLMQVDHPDVKAAAREAVGEEKDARKAAERIADYVFTKLDKRSGSIGEYSAVEILRHGFGDCSEHALLFVTLCRAAGIPARRVNGTVCLGNVWGNHAWGEIWLGRWIGGDPCTNDIGTAGRYVCFGYPDDPFGKTGVVSEAFTGYTRLRLLEGTFGDGEAVNLAGKETTFGTLSDGTGYSHLAGAACRRPRPGWSSVGTPDGLRVRGKRLTANVRVQPDQGSRGTAHLRKIGFGDMKDISVQGFPAVAVRRMGPTSYLLVSADRRIVIIQISMEGGTPDERKAEWNDFFHALDLTAWKGRPVKAVADAPPFEEEAEEKGPGEEKADDGEGEEKGGGEEGE